MLSDWRIRARSVFKRREVERELDDELRFHVERQTQAYEEAGLDHAEAVRRARLDFGGLDQVKEECRDARGVGAIEHTMQDLRFAARLLAKDRWFTLAVVIVLTLAIGVNTTVFTLVNAALLRELPFEHAEDVVSLGTRDARSPAVHGPVGYQGLSLREFDEWRRSARAFADIAAYADATMNVSDDTLAPERFRGAYVSANTFRLLGRAPLLGRDFRADDDRPGALPVVMLGYRVWVNRYAADREIVGRTIRVNATPAAVIGVMPAGFGFPLTADVWQPLAHMPGLLDRSRDRRVLNGVGRLAIGVAMPSAQSDLDAIAERLSRQFPDPNAGIRATVWPYADRHIAPQVRLVVAALMGAVIFVLLIGCANVANLLLARAAHRSHEISIRVSIGATRWRVVRQLLTESILLALAGTVAGYGMSIAGVRLLWSVLETSNPPYWLQLTMDVRTFAFLAALCLGTAILFGLAPALFMSSTKASQALKQSRRMATGGFRLRRWTGVLMTAEIALTLVLLAGAGFMMRSFFRAYSARPNVETSQVVAMRVDLPLVKYRTPEQRVAFVRQLEERLGRLDSVAAGSVSSAVPFEPAPRRELAIDGRAVVSGSRPPRVSTATVGGGFFQTLKLPLAGGRWFTDVDGTPGREAAIVNERFAALYFPGEDPIGHRIRLEDPDAPDPASAPWVTVVGVAPTVRRDVTRDGDPIVYLPYRAQPAQRLAVLVRAARERDAVVPQVREEVRALDPDLPLFDISTLDERLAFLRWPERVFGTMFTIFAGIGLIMAAVGLYAVTAYSVKQRTQEIGIRMALGARAPQVWWLVLRRVIVQLLVGLTLGLPAALIVARLPWMDSADALILLPIVLAVLLVTGVAAFLPARRATRVDPLSALRYE